MGGAVGGEVGGAVGGEVGGAVGGEVGGAVGWMSNNASDKKNEIVNQE